MNVRRCQTNFEREIQGLGNVRRCLTKMQVILMGIFEEIFIIFRMVNAKTGFAYGV